MSWKRTLPLISLYKKQATDFGCLSETNRSIFTSWKASSAEDFFLPAKNRLSADHKLFTNVSNQKPTAESLASYSIWL
jgi:hypothetical protein